VLKRLVSDLAQLGSPVRRYLVGSALMGLAFAVPWTLLALYLDRVGLSKAEIGNVSSAQSWGRAAVALPAAFLLASRRTVPVLAATSLVAALAYVCLPWMPHRYLMYVASFVGGFADQVHHVAIAPFLFRHTRPAERAGAFAFAEAVHTLMAVAGSFGSGRAVEWIAPHLGGERIAMAWVLTGAALLALVASPVFAGISEGERTVGARVPVLRTALRHRGLILRFAVPQFLLALGAGLVIPFLGLYFQDRFGFTPSGVGSLFAAGQVLMTTGFLASPELLRRAGYVRGIVTVEVLSIPFFLVLAFTQSAPLAIAAFLVRGALMNTAHPILKNLMMQATPDGLRELQNGVLGLSWGLAWVIGPHLGGRILDATSDGYALLMCTTVCFYLSASLCTWLLLRPVERALPESDDA